MMIRQCLGETSLPRRPRIPKAIEDALLVSCQHRCCICQNFGVQIHHIDGDPTNNREDNLIPLCGQCSQIVHISFPAASRTHGITKRQLGLYKKNWIERCSSLKPTTFIHAREFKESLFQVKGVVGKKRKVKR